MSCFSVGGAARLGVPNAGRLDKTSPPPVSGKICSRVSFSNGSGSRVSCGWSKRAGDVDQQQLLARLAHHGPNDRQIQLARTDQRVELQIDATFQVHFAAALQADRVAVEIDPVQVDVLALDAKVDFAAGERRRIGLANAEQFQQGQHHGDLVDVRLEQTDRARAAPGRPAITIAAERQQRVGTAADVLTLQFHFLSKLGQIAALQSHLQAIRQFRLKADSDIRRQLAADRLCGQRLRGASLDVGFRFRTKDDARRVDQQRSGDAGQLNVAVHHGIDVQVTAAGKRPVPAAADQVDVTVQVLDGEAALQTGVLNVQNDVPGGGGRLAAGRGAGEGQGTLHAQVAVQRQTFDRFAQFLGQRRQQVPIETDAIGDDIRQLHGPRAVVADAARAADADLRFFVRGGDVSQLDAPVAVMHRAGHFIQPIRKPSRLDRDAVAFVVRLLSPFLAGDLDAQGLAGGGVMDSDGQVIDGAPRTQLVPQQPCARLQRVPQFVFQRHLRAGQVQHQFAAPRRHTPPETRALDVRRVVAAAQILERPALVIPQQLAANHGQRIRKPLVVHAAVEQLDADLPMQFGIPRVGPLEAALDGQHAGRPQRSHDVAGMGVDQRGQQFFVERDRLLAAEFQPARRVRPGAADLAPKNRVLAAGRGSQIDLQAVVLQLQRPAAAFQPVGKTVIGERNVMTGDRHFGSPSLAVKVEPELGVNGPRGEVLPPHGLQVRAARLPGSGGPVRVGEFRPRWSAGSGRASPAAPVAASPSWHRCGHRPGPARHARCPTQTGRGRRTRDRAAGCPGFGRALRAPLTKNRIGSAELAPLPALNSRSSRPLTAATAARRCCRSIGSAARSWGDHCRPRTLPPTLQAALRCVDQSLKLDALKLVSRDAAADLHGRPRFLGGRPSSGDSVRIRSDLQASVAEIQGPPHAASRVGHLHGGVADRHGRVRRTEFGQRPQSLDVPRAVLLTLGPQFQSRQGTRAWLAVVGRTATLRRQAWHSANTSLT